MQPGSFYCYVPKKGAVAGWLPFCKTGQRSVYRKLNALLKKDAESEAPELDDSDLFHCSHYDPSRDCTTLVYPGAGVHVQPGRLALTSHLSRKEPNVYTTEKAFIVLHGYISNLEDLCGSMGRLSPFYMRDVMVNNDENGAELTIGDLAARVLLHLYLGDKAKDPLLVLSELQGHYAFVIYDSEDRSLFAARDASGKQPLYYSPDHEKGMALSNVELHGEGLEESWMEVPAGHYFYGRHPQLMQFALTPDQLTVRWSLDLDSETEFYSSLDSNEHETRRSWSLGWVDTFRNRISPHTCHDCHNPYSQTL